MKKKIFSNIKNKMLHRNIKKKALSQIRLRTMRCKTLETNFKENVSK